MKAWLAALWKVIRRVPGRVRDALALSVPPRARGKIPAITAWIGGRRPRVWALFYIFTVPIAGFVFWLLPSGSFYDSNLTREAGYSHDLATIASQLSSAIQDQESLYATQRHLTWSAGEYRYILELTTTQILTGSVAIDTSGHISFTIVFFAVTFWKNHQQGDSLFEVNVTLSAFTETYAQSPSARDTAAFTVTFAREIDSHLPPPMDIVLPPHPETVKTPTASQSEIWVNASTDAVIFHLTNAANGNPEEASGLYIRMCYLSAVTITTLGFGDITPVNSWARALVGTEAVFGVVLVGLFLNAVAQKWGKKPPERPASGFHWLSQPVIIRRSPRTTSSHASSRLAKLKTGRAFAGESLQRTERAARPVRRPQDDRDQYCRA